MNGFRIVPIGDSVLVVEFDARIDVEVNARAVAVADAVWAGMIDGVLDVVPTFRSVGVYFDPLKTDVERLVKRLEQDAAAASGKVPDTIPIVSVPVCYGGVAGPDLREVASVTGMSEGEVIALHAAPIYRVFMLGFAPGFAYLGVVDQRIAVPRRAVPRTHVPPGSVAIAGQQTGVYPSSTPGGWQLIGRTPFKPYDAGKADPFLFKPGDRIRFYPVTPAEYETMSRFRLSQ